MENLPFKTEQFESAWNEWLEYRKERRLPKYVPKGLQKTFAGLIRISENNESVAIAILNQSMELNYQGLFPLKNVTNGNQNGSFKQNNSHKPVITGTATGAGKI
jgi:hypothetical protein